MKKINVFYWIFTGLIAALMLFSAIGSFTASPQSVEMMHQLGYQMYTIKFLSVAKLLGIIAILVPGYPRLKEWAYAGFTFDLLGATYSFIAVGKPAAEWLPMFVFIGLLAASYILWHKKQAAIKAKQQSKQPAFA